MKFRFMLRHVIADVIFIMEELLEQYSAKAKFSTSYLQFLVKPLTKFLESVYMKLHFGQSEIFSFQCLVNFL